MEQSIFSPHCSQLGFVDMPYIIDEKYIQQMQKRGVFAIIIYNASNDTDSIYLSLW